MGVPEIHIVDDDAAICASTRRLLRPLGYPVHVHASAEEFLTNTSPASLGCLVLDLSLPGLNGLQLQERMAEEGWTLPVVFITSHFDQSSHDAALARGAAAFLRKPFACDQLLSIVARVLETSQATAAMTARTDERGG